MDHTLLQDSPWNSKQWIGLKCILGHNMNNVVIIPDSTNRNFLHNQSFQTSQQWHQCRSMKVQYKIGLGLGLLFCSSYQSSFFRKSVLFKKTTHINGNSTQQKNQFCLSLICFFSLTIKNELSFGQFCLRNKVDQ